MTKLLGYLGLGVLGYMVFVGPLNVYDGWLYVWLGLGPWIVGLAVLALVVVAIIAVFLLGAFTERHARIRERD